jgi:hypothetical protein
MNTPAVGRIPPETFIIIAGATGLGSRWLAKSNHVHTLADDRRRLEQRSRLMHVEVGQGNTT